MTSFQSTLGDEPGIAEELAKGQREISIAEFFEKNKHMLGFDSGARGLVTAVKEAVDNALDATEEAGIQPDIYVEIAEAGDYYRLVIEDNPVTWSQARRRAVQANDDGPDHARLGGHLVVMTEAEQAWVFDQLAGSGLDDALDGGVWIGAYHPTGAENPASIAVGDEGTDVVRWVTGEERTLAYSGGGAGGADFLRIEAVIDGGPAITVLELRGDKTTNGVLREDSNLDGIGDGGVAVGPSALPFTKLFGATGVALVHGVTMSFDAHDEDVAIDDLLVTGELP